jgi:hypothetical protein
METPNPKMGSKTRQHPTYFRSRLTRDQQMEPPPRRPILSRATPLSPAAPVTCAHSRPTAPPPTSGRSALDPHTLQHCRPRTAVPTPSSAAELHVVSPRQALRRLLDRRMQCQCWCQVDSCGVDLSRHHRARHGRERREGAAGRGGPCWPWQGGEEDGFWSPFWSLRWRSMFFGAISDNPGDRNGEIGLKK